MNFKTQRFSIGHPLYSNVVITNNDPDRGLIGQFQATFGQFINEDGGLQDYTMERRDTLIPEGTYDYSFYNSPDNKMKVLLLHDVPGFNYIEHHPANWPFQLKGCTAHGANVDVKMPQLDNSRNPFLALIAKISAKYPEAKLSYIGAAGLVYGDVLGQITYEKYQPLNT